MALKANPNYKPDKDEVEMYLDNLYKSSYTNLKGMMIFLHMEYPSLSNNEIKRFMKGWIDSRKIPIK